MFRKIMYWIISCTWGFIMTFIGAIAALVLFCKKVKFEKIGPSIFFRIGKGWGGINLGPFFIVSKDAQQETILHEAGHSIQNLIWGPLFPFVIALPSVLRYWVRIFNQEERFKFTVTICTMIICSIDIILMIVALVSGNPFWWVLLAIWSAYVVLLGVWMCFKEIPKYKHGLTTYNSIWFEGQATELGYRYFQ